MAAEQDGFALLVAAIGVAALAIFEIDQRHQPRAETDTAELDRLSALAHGSWLLSAWLRHRPVVRPIWGASPMRLPRPMVALRLIAGAELRINRIGDFRIEHPTRPIFAQRLGMRRRPIVRFHDQPFCGAPA